MTAPSATMGGVQSLAIHELRLHPDADRVPAPDAADLRALRQSLSEDGQQDPIDVTEAGVILDGRTRWNLLRDLGAETIQVRVVYVPEDQQTHYIVNRALTRRHLSAAQKQALNAVLRSVVTEIATHPVTGEEVRIGMGQTQRARTLGVTPQAIRKWDAAAATSNDLLVADDGPTHMRLTGKRSGDVIPLHPIREAAAKPAARAKARTATAPAAPTRPAPPWFRHYVKWCRAVLPEDRTYVARLSAEIHKSMALLGMSCAEGEAK